MYKADGFDLSKSSYEMLKELAQLGDGETKTFTHDYSHDISVLLCLKELHLVERGPWSENQAEFWATQLGRDFIEDYAEEERLREEERSRREKHDMEMANRSGLFGLAGVVLGFVLSLLMTLIIGQVPPIAP